MNTPIPAQDVCPEPGAISRSCILALDLGTTPGWAGAEAAAGASLAGRVSARRGAAGAAGPG